MYFLDNRLFLEVNMIIYVNMLHAAMVLSRPPSLYDMKYLRFKFP